MATALFCGAVRNRQLLTDEEWSRIRRFSSRRTSVYLKSARNTYPDGSILSDPDTDFRTAVWLQISTACRLTSPARRDQPPAASLIIALERRSDGAARDSPG